MNKQVNFRLTLIALLLFTFSLNSCDTYQRVQIANKEIESNFNESQKKWNDLKAVHNNSYEYQIGYASWVGYRNTTTIVVKNGEVIAREYAETQRDGNGQFMAEETLIYQEDKTDINSHEQGFEGVTFDQIYQNCGNKSLQVNETENNLYFKVDEMGLLQSCGYTEKNCADDCSRGVYISSFKWLE